MNLKTTNHLHIYIMIQAILGAGLHAEPLVTDRPDATESSSVVGKGTIQLETGISRAEDASGTEGTEIGNTLLRLGIFENWEARVGWEGYFDSRNLHGSGDMLLGTKVNLKEEEGWSPEAAILAHTTVPVGKEALSRDAFDPDLLFSFSHTLSPELSIGYNLGASLETSRTPAGNKTTRSSALYSVAAGYTITDHWGTYIEFFGSEALSAKESTRYINGGLTYLINDDLQLDAFGGFGLNDAADDWFVGLGLSKRWR